MALIFCLNKGTETYKKFGGSITSQIHLKTIRSGIFNFRLHANQLLSSFHYSLTLHRHQPSFAPDLIRNLYTHSQSLKQAHPLLAIERKPISLIFDNLPAITVLFPSSTTRGSRDRDESITFPSISLPWKQEEWEKKGWKSLISCVYISEPIVQLVHISQRRVWV